MVRYTEVTVTPTADSLGLNTGSFSLKDIFTLKSEGEIGLGEYYRESNRVASTEYTYTLDHILNTNYGDLNEDEQELRDKLELLDPSFVDVRKLQATLHTGRFESITDRLGGQILPEYRNYYDTRGKMWNEGVKIYFDIQHNGANTKSIEGDVEMWNLGAGTLQVIKAGAHIQIKSGYDYLYNNIFIGTITEVITEREDEDVRTMLKISGGYPKALTAPCINGTILSGITTNNTDTVAYVRDKGVRECIEEWLNAGVTDSVSPTIDTSRIPLYKYGIDIVFQFPQDDSFLALMRAIAGIDENFEREDFFSDISFLTQPVYQYQFVKNTETYEAGLNALKNNLYFDWMIINGRLYIIWPGLTLPVSVRLSYLTGLINFNETPRSNEISGELLSEYTVQSVLLPNIFPESLIAIQTSASAFDVNTDQYFIINSINYKSTEDEHIVEFKCRPASAYKDQALYVSDTFPGDEEDAST